MADQLKGKKIAILVANGFEQIEMTEPRLFLEEAGAQTDLISPETDKVKGWETNQWGDEFDIDIPLSQAKSSNYQALLLPGGVMNPDKLRLNKEAIEFVKEFYKQNKPIAAICHGPWILIDAEIAKDRKMTSWPSIKNDLINAGAHWVDQEVVIDNKLLTSRKPDDIPSFIKAMLQLFA
ncbi:MAG: type 1 glutamine amidotransferase [Tatlockia sp.]|nr:type 1 glutamine amidotransferase [Tatlockia sp.]